MYSEQVLDHFQRPRNTGDLAGAAAVVEVENPACGDVLRLSARLDDQQRIEVRFLARGCVAAVAASSVLTELLNGTTLAEAESLQRDQIIAHLGSLPAESTHASHLAIDAAHALLKKLRATRI
jgi:nitrogen fixation NifU-like protein